LNTIKTVRTLLETSQKHAVQRDKLFQHSKIIPIRFSDLRTMSENEHPSENQGKHLFTKRPRLLDRDTLDSSEENKVKLLPNTSMSSTANAKKQNSHDSDCQESLIDGK
jgi:hypothetical protein